MTEYPYMISNNKIPMIFDKILTAAKPQRFTNELLTQMGFSSSNDRAFTNLLKKLEFLTSDGVPTSYYDDLRDVTKAKSTIAKRIKSFYNELFTINTNINEAPDEEVKGAIARITGKEQKDVKRIFSTFKALCSYADFSIDDTVDVRKNEQNEKNENSNSKTMNDNISNIMPNFHYNIQIHLPATTDISVYNAIFKSIKENLL